MPLSNILAIQLGGNYSQKGSVNEGDLLGSAYESPIEYVEVPALLAVTPGLGESLGARFYAGPTIAFMVKCWPAHPLFGIPADCDHESEGGLKQRDFGGAVGAGFTFDLGPTLLVEGFYTLSLDTITDSYDDMRNQVFSVSAGLMVPLGDQLSGATDR